MILKTEGLDLKLFNFFDINLNNESIFNNNKIKKTIKNSLKNTTFDKLKINLQINTLDLKSGKELIFTNKGLKDKNKILIYPRKITLYDAIFSSISIPGIFPPYKLKDYLLVDIGPFSPFQIKDINNYKYIIIVDTSMRNLNFIEEKISISNVIKQYIASSQKTFFNEKIKKITTKKKQY